MNLLKLKSKIQNFPQAPGVYVYYGKNREVLYVGKTGSLRDRVRSYFSGHDRRETVNVMLPQITDIKIHKTDTVLEALILESQLIKKLQPKYNAIGKDDKSFCYFVITCEEYPRVLILRKTEIAEFPISKFRFPNKFKVQNSKFPAKVRSADGGKITIQNLFGPYTSKKQMEIALKIMRRIFPFHSNKQKTEKGCLDFELGLCPGPYAGAITRADYLKNIRSIQMILEGKKKSLVKKLEKEMREYAKNNEFEKAADIRNKLFALKHIRDIALISEDNKLQVMSYKLRDLRIEAYDISNISGDYATGSMVVFENNEPNKGQYRRFKIKTIKGSDDVGMMREILKRRFKNNWPKPDLILLDGGIGHLNMTKKLLQELKLSIPLVAVAKGPTRKISNSQFLISNEIPISRFPNLKSVIADKNLIKQIMDEAHRFAIVYHRKLRGKNLLG